MSKRDVHFAEFAQMLAIELTKAGVFFDAVGSGQHIIACRAYDLVQHTRKYITDEVHEGNFLTWMLPSDIPDMTEWPES